MGSVKSYNNGTLMKLTPKPARLGGLVAGINPDEAVTMAQFNALQDGTVDVSRVELAESGTAAAPVITWDGDTDTGFYRIGANQIGATTGGTLRLTVSSSGIDVVGAITATTSITATTTLASTTSTSVGTVLNIGTNQTFTKQTSHTILVSASDTGNEAGGNLTISSGEGFGTGGGGTLTISSATSGAGATGNGGLLKLVGANASSTNGNGGAITITAGGKTGSGIGAQVHLRSATNTPVLIKRAAAGTGADTVTLTVAQLFNGIFNQTSTAATTCTTPTGAEISAALGTSLDVGDSFDFCLINTGGTGDNITFTAGASGVTITGHAVVYPAADVGTAGAASGTFRFVNTAADTWVAYRIA